MPTSSLVFQAETQLPTVFGSFRFRVYKNTEGAEAMAIATRGLENRQEIPVREVRDSQCATKLHTW